MSENNTPDSPNESNRISIEDAVAELTAIEEVEDIEADIDADDDAPKATEAVDNAGDEQPDNEPDSDGEEDDLEEVEDDAEEADEDEEPSEDDEDEGEFEPIKVGDDREIPIEIGGEVLNLTGDQIARGLMMQADYSRKTQALAEEKRAFSSEKETTLAEREKFIKQRELYEEALPRLAKALDPEGDEWAKVNWQQEFATDEAAATIKWAKYQSYQNRKNAIEAESQRIAQEKTQEEHQIEQESRHELARVLPNMFPEWSQSAETMQKDLAEMTEFARNLGYTEQEISKTLDPRTYALLKYATIGVRAINGKSTPKTDTSQKAKSKAPEKPSQKKPKGLRVLRSSTPRPQAKTTKASAAKRAKETFNKQPSLESAVAALMANG